MTRTTPDLAPPSPNFRATPTHSGPVSKTKLDHCATGGRLATTYDLACGGSSVESGFEPATLRSRGRDLTTRPPRPHTLFESVIIKVVLVVYRDIRIIRLRRQEVCDVTAQLKCTCSEMLDDVVRFPSREHRSHGKERAVPFDIGGKQQDSCTGHR
ncbi:hypothetical protein AVEN_204553-1 [Araneus ventricosus]|uniref:Uncharacterized protein n=1 Tax=Araneus ventricosus TaxID=182803 RepID=A0A4Y2MA59_ARAVE|nr:hypothetical protein AVEN_204553-1 [Araneus ventricosus]